jgi:hypothetical protein
LCGKESWKSPSVSTRLGNLSWCLWFRPSRGIERLEIAAVMGARPLNAPGLGIHPVLTFLHIAIAIPEVPDTGEVTTETSWRARDEFAGIG